MNNNKLLNMVRAKTIKGEKVIGYYYYNPNVIHNHRLISLDGLSTNIIIDPNHIDLYLGKDINGEKIFEGDTVIKVKIDGTPYKNVKHFKIYGLDKYLKMFGDDTLNEQEKYIKRAKIKCQLDLGYYKKI